MDVELLVERRRRRGGRDDDDVLTAVLTGALISSSVDIITCSLPLHCGSASSLSLHWLLSPYSTFNDSRISLPVITPNFVTIDQTVAEIWRFRQRRGSYFTSNLAYISKFGPSEFHRTDIFSQSVKQRYLNSAWTLLRDVA